MSALERLFAAGGGRTWCLAHPAITFTKAAVASCGPALGTMGECMSCSEPPLPDWLAGELPDHGSLWLVDKQHAYLTAMREVQLPGIGRAAPYRPLADWLTAALAETGTSGDEAAHDWVKAVYRVGIGCLPIRGHADWRCAIIARHVYLMEVMLTGLRRLPGIEVLGQGNTDGFLVWWAHPDGPSPVRSRYERFDLDLARRLMAEKHPPRSLSALVAASKRQTVRTRG